MGYVADRLVLDHIRIQGCKQGDRVFKALDINIGDEDAILLYIDERSQKSIRVANILLARFLALEPPEEIPRLSIPKAPLCLW